MKRLRLHKLLILVQLFSFSFVGLAQNDLSAEISQLSSSTIDENHSDEKLNLLFQGTFFSVSNSELGTDLNGVGASFQAIYNLTSDFGIGGGAGTVMGEGGGGAATVLNWAFTYALTGSLNSLVSDYRLDGRKVVSAKNNLSEGLRAQFLFSQYYFNGTESTVPYAGIGGHLYYQKYFEFIGSTTVFGVRIDQLFNNEISLMPITIGIGAIF